MLVLVCVCVMGTGTGEGEVEGREGTLRRVKGYSFQVRPCKRQEQGSIELAGAGAGAISAGAGARCKSQVRERGQAQVPVLGKYPLVGDRLWVGARVSRYQSTPSRRTACLGVWGRGESEGGVRVKREKEKNGRGWSSESRGVKPMSGRGQRWTSRHPTQQDKERLRYPARRCRSGVAKKMMSTLHQVVVVSEVGRP